MTITEKIDQTIGLTSEFNRIPELEERVKEQAGFGTEPELQELKKELEGTQAELNLKRNKLWELGQRMAKANSAYDENSGFSVKCQLFSDKDFDAVYQQQTVVDYWRNYYSQLIETVNSAIQFLND